MYRIPFTVGSHVATDTHRSIPVHANKEAPTAGGRWIITFASDIEVGDKIRRNGAERIVTGREHPPGCEPVFRIAYLDGAETLAKSAHIAIWDPDGSVQQRVTSLSAAAIR